MSAAFRNLIVWQKAFLVSQQVYLLTKNFPSEERYGLSDQMRRASVSIVSNIAEGSNRGSNLEYAHFLAIARGSTAELQTQLLLAEAFAYVSSEKIQEIIDICDEIMKITTTLIQKYKQ